MTHITRPSALSEGQRDLPKQIVCFSHLRWNFVFQRPQHLMTRAAAEFNVTIVEEPVYERHAEPHLRREYDGSITILVPVLPEGLAEPEIAGAQRRLLAGELDGKDFIAWYYTPLSLAFSDRLPAAVVVYDNMDELAAFKNAPAGLLAAERQLLARADVVFTGGRSLFEAKKDRHQNIHCFPSSIDMNHFGRARTPQPAPEDQKNIGHPCIGFFGVVDERMDIELVADLAELQPDWQFVILGPVVKIDPATLPRRANLHWLGSKSYGSLPDYLAHWDVGMMPFALNESTQFISPTKTPEFLAAGVPVVSTAIADVVASYGRPDLVKIATTAKEFVLAIHSLLNDTPSQKAAWLSRVDDQLASTSWDQTWSEMRGLIGKAIGPIGGAPASLAQYKGSVNV